ncbi:MAG: hypothetical protein H7X85_04990 [Thermoanaerobaculia bacterium]|nr:hypothetical protein [Thermoanaerobaculia bacterium]
MTVSQALVLEELLEGKGYAKKPGGLLAGLEGKLRLASELPSRSEPRTPLPTGAASLDSLLEGGLPKGKLVELVGRRSSGRFSIGIAALATQTSRGEAAALVDLGGNLDPSIAEAAGVDLQCLLWARPQKLKDALASAEMLLATGFPLVVLDLGLPPVRGERYAPDAAWVRLARAAQTQGAALLVSSPFRMSGIAAEVVLSAGSGGVRWQGGGESLRLLIGVSARLRLEKDSHSRPGASVAEPLVVIEAVGAGLVPAPTIPIDQVAIRLSA